MAGVQKSAIEHAQAVGEAVDRLNKACADAANAGLRVELDRTDYQTVLGIHPRIMAEVLQPLEMKAPR